MTLGTDRAVPPPPAAAGPLMSPAEYGASRATLWTGASVLFTDEDGRVLVESVDYRDVRLLPGGGVDPGEAPSAAARREVREELGLDADVRRVLAVDWVPAGAPGYDPAMNFPGEILYVFDGGTLTPARIRSIALPGHEVTGVHFVEPALLARHMDPADARRALTALRARVDGGGPAVLENGRPSSPTALDRLELPRAPREPGRPLWHPGPAPSGVPVTECRGWLFAGDGRVLLLADPISGAVTLPGGAVAPADGPRAAARDARVRVGEPWCLGHLRDDVRGRVDVRFAAAVTYREPAAPGGPVRLLATPEQAAEILGTGPVTAGQLDAVHAARARLGLPRAERRPVTEADAEDPDDR
ncbi:NUDIX domain-containing protein [Streptantibioticus cattleyicolor]|uniref:Nudix hydrolase domain-containing protein n=1 Tax=Streptantibioticus cattleyicolor (strain ATCC 35852 / DSM 46488 / JCM 4925 / NBRC 14057 / NRRL 8057) TaxID=1003195 RepID=F8JJA5_STREN|nr:NUDIX hydrolase [Streptantibioticus cattleyicolor]AEW98785.1 hypothetical protein SCATT_p05920 [Streptantibioticus cattleyicolor NRRL 8057 = DSM 46488]CCB72164.1 conserved protein of unknown function [Streptantibioticus cattleyicolor NRRL 8057 = DSM 46488]